MKKGCYLILAGTFLGIVIAEIVIRLIAPEAISPDEYRSRYIEYQPAVFARHIFPERAQLYYNESSKTKASVNSLGYRGKEFTLEKPADTFRIVVFGGSFTFDIYNADDDTWAEILEKKLSVETNRKIQIINAGIPGHSASDAVGRLFSEIHTLKPDMALLPIGWNDIKDLSNFKQLIRYRPVYSEKNYPYRYYQGSLDAFLGKISKSYLHVRTAYYNIKLNPTVEGREVGETGKEEIAPPAAAQLELTLKTFSNIASDIGTIPVFILEPTFIKKDTAPEERGYIGYGYTPFSHAGLVFAYENIEKVVRQVAAIKNAQIIDLKDSMNGHKAYFFDHVHLTKEGAAVFSDLISTQLLKIMPH